jgi:hypothetical protein
MNAPPQWEQVLWPNNARLSAIVRHRFEQKR